MLRHMSGQINRQISERFGPRLNRSQASVIATLVIALVLIAAASFRYSGFFSAPVMINLFDDNAFLGIAAIGMTFVILSGGIDLSMGSMIGFTSIASALLVEHSHVHPIAAAVIVLIVGILFGALQGMLIAYFEIAPFLVTLAGLFFLRGAAYSLSLESVALTHPIYRELQSARLSIGWIHFPPLALFFFLTAAIGFYVTTQTRFGRTVFAVGGNPASALLMGLPVRRILVSIYALSGFCGALAGLTYSVYTSSGNATAAMGLELDVIAAVVIGGTLLTGGQGSIIGTVLGVLILGAIQTIITFNGTLNSWWTRIFIGGLLFFFVVLQKLLSYLWIQRTRKLRTQPSLVLILFLTSFVTSVASAVCPVGTEAGARLDLGLVELTGTQTKIGQLDSTDLSDPAPPFLNPDGSVEIYGSSQTFARYSTRADFEDGGCFVRVALDLRQDNGIAFPSPYSHPWDVRKFRIEPKSKLAYEILIAGTMSRSGTNTFPIWPDDNMNRRIYMFRRDAQGLWKRDVAPIIGTPDPVWIGHSYGGNLIQVGMKDQNVIRPDDKGEIAFFYERVSDDTDGTPFKTEIFATKISHFVAANPEIPIFKINTPAYPALKRTVGGFLAEGPRPIEMKINGQTFFIVAFSAGDFPTDSYTTNYAWSKSLMGPYQPALIEDGSDLLDLGQQIKTEYNLSWMGRPSIFKSPAGNYEMMFHAVRKDLYPGHDFTRWPNDSLEYYRALFKVTLDVSLNAKGEPVLRANTHRATL